MNRDALALVLMVIGAALTTAGVAIVFALPGGLIMAGVYCVLFGILLAWGD